METHSDAAAPPTGPPPFVQIPLHRRDGSIRAHALVDVADLHLVEGKRWYYADGYAVRSVPPDDGQKYQGRESMARVILGLGRGDPREADHIVTEHKLDNRRVNLRIASHAENAQNRKRRGGSSQYRGVSRRATFTTREWQAYVCYDGKQHHLGFFEDEKEAAAIAAAARKQHLPFATE